MGPRSGTQSLALRRQQMAAEQPGRRETLIVRSEWLSVGGVEEGEAQREPGILICPCSRALRKPRAVAP